MPAPDTQVPTRRTHDAQCAAAGRRAVNEARKHSRMAVRPDHRFLVWSPPGPWRERRNRVPNWTRKSVEFQPKVGGMRAGNAAVALPSGSSRCRYERLLRRKCAFCAESTPPDRKNSGLGTKSLEPAGLIRSVAPGAIGWLTVPALVAFWSDPLLELDDAKTRLLVARFPFGFRYFSIWLHDESPFKQVVVWEREQWCRGRPGHPPVPCLSKERRIIGEKPLVSPFQRAGSAAALRQRPGPVEPEPGAPLLS